jgi:uncharacterized protein (DUF58 family)
VLTPKGWLALGAALALLVGGFFVGAPLYVLGSTLLVLLAASLLLLGTASVDVHVDRHVHPERVQAGSACRIDVVVRNDGRRRSGIVALRDVISGTEGIELVVRPLAPGATGQAAYQLPTSRRGIIEVGPLTLRWSDPFGLAERPVQAVGRREITVLPRIEPVAPLPRASRDEPRPGADHTRAASTNGGEFYALRPYAVGDDLRRVHWASSARHDDLLVRQEDQPWQGRTTILLDTAPGSTTDAGLELAVSAAASVLTAANARQDVLRLLTTTGHDSGFGVGHAHAAALLEHLALLERAEPRTGSSALDRLGATARGGALVVITSLLGPAELRPVVAVAARFGSLVLVRFDPSSWGGAGPALDDVVVPGTEVRATAATPFRQAWDRAVLGRRPARAARGPAT